MSDIIKVSPLGKTWLLDLDGTIVKHNGYKIDGKDTFLSGAQKLLSRIPDSDMIIFLTSRTENERGLTEKFLSENNIRYDQIIYNVPYGERILINDKKPSGLTTALAINPLRDALPDIVFEVDESL